LTASPGTRVGRPSPSSQWIEQPEFVHAHAWEAQGIAVWDNRTTQHDAHADHWPHRRINQRMTFDAHGRAPQDGTTTLDRVSTADRHGEAACGA